MHLAFAIPDPVDTGSGGGADYVRGLVQALLDLGHAVDLLTGPDDTLPAGAVPIIDGMLLPKLRPRLDDLVAADAVVLVHHVSAAAGRDAGAREQVRAIEAEMLPRMRRVVATSAPVAERLGNEFNIAAELVPPGARDLPRATPADDDPVILSVGVLTRRKGHDLLLRAASRLTDLPWRLVIAGDSGREPAHAAELAALIDELGLAHRAELHADPSPETMQRLWRTASLFALATRWEGYPAAVAEALRRGIPVVVTTAGDPGKLVPVEAGAVVPLDELPSFGKAMRRILFDRTLRHDLADAAWHAGQQLPTWRTRAERFAAYLET
jgi:glycosyltransferase involved in cell wall biosynthesis